MGSALLLGATAAMSSAEKLAYGKSYTNVSAADISRVGSTPITSALKDIYAMHRAISDFADTLTVQDGINMVQKVAMASTPWTGVYGAVVERGLDIPQAMYDAGESGFWVAFKRLLGATDKQLAPKNK